MSTSEAREAAEQRRAGESAGRAFRRLYGDQPEPTDFHRWFCAWHQIPADVREFFAATKPSDNSEALLRECYPGFVSRAEFFEACEQCDDALAAEHEAGIEVPAVDDPVPAVLGGDHA